VSLPLFSRSDAEGREPARGVSWPPCRPRGQGCGPGAGRRRVYVVKTLERAAAAVDGLGKERPGWRNRCSSRSARVGQLDSGPARGLEGPGRRPARGPHPLRNRAPNGQDRALIIDAQQGVLPIGKVVLRDGPTVARIVRPRGARAPSAGLPHRARAGAPAPPPRAGQSGARDPRRGDAHAGEPVITKHLPGSFTTRRRVGAAGLGVERVIVSGS
jgi:hypothetical protein